MPYINLIQEQRLAARANERKARTFFGVFVGILVASGAAIGVITFEADSVGGKAAQLKAQNQKNAPLVKQIEETGKLLGDLTPRLKTLEDAQIITDRWNRILEHLAQQTPKDAWLTGVRCLQTDPTKPIAVSFSGLSKAQAPVGEFILRLQNLEDLSNVNLKFTGEKLIATTKGIEFEIGADITDTAEQKAKKEVEGEEKAS